MSDELLRNLERAAKPGIYNAEIIILSSGSYSDFSINEILLVSKQLAEEIKAKDKEYETEYDKAYQEYRYLSNIPYYNPGVSEWGKVIAIRQKRWEWREGLEKYKIPYTEMWIDN